MKTNYGSLAIIGGLCVLLIIFMTSGCGKHAAPDTEAGREEHGENDGHGHAGEVAAAPSASIEERLSAKCEHGVPIYQCAECRYEAGVVKLDASLLKREDGRGLIRTQTVDRAKVSATLQTTAEVALNDNTAVHISPRIAGIIESVPIDIGARVNTGDTLLTLVSVELGNALAEYERNRTLSDLSEKIFARETRLREQKVSSGQDVIDAQMKYEHYRTELKASKQKLHVLGLTEDDLAVMVDPAGGIGDGHLPIRAPIAGTIIQKHAVTGELAEPGKDLMLLADLSTVWVWANVHSRDLARLLEAEKHGPIAVEITVSAFTGRQFKGVLDYVGATMSEQTRTVKVRATVKNPDLALRPGMFCEASIALNNGQAEEVLAAPRTAVFSDEGKSFVFRHWKDDFFVRQDIRIGREFFGVVEIREGLQTGDVIVTDGAFLLKSDILREKMGAGCAD